MLAPYLRDRGRQPCLVDDRRVLRGTGHEVVADLGLEAVVAVEVQQPVVPPQHARVDEGRAAYGVRPGLRVGPGQVGGRGPDLVERQADRAAADRAHGEGQGQQHPLVVLAAERTDAGGDVEVGGGEQQAVVERGEQAGAAAREPPVVLAGRLEELGHRDTTRPASRSESSSTSGTGARQVNTPHGIPSTIGVSGPHMPRT